MSKLFPSTLIVALLFAGRLVWAEEQEGPAKPGTAAKQADADKGGEKADEKGKNAVENPFPNRSPAPSFDGGTGWLNTSGEITLKDVRGKIVLLDFWTYCCINCMHVLPDLAYLEKKYPNEVVVIGVHSAKFDNEKDTENIRRAIVRYEIEHPVINDSEMVVWRKFGARAWPTLVLVDPEGQYCGYVSGEGNRELLAAVIDRLIEYHESKGTLDRTPVHFALEREKLDPTPLKFPGKITADVAGNRLFITDSNHNRIVIASLEGKLLDIVGSGAIGRDDGGYQTATFDHPQGTCLVGSTLYVADTENHLMRMVDLEKKSVSTLAGTGVQAQFRSAGGELKTSALNSPWDIEHVDGTLFVAMAGPHQIWSHKLGSETIGVYAGSGREDVTNGPFTASAFAQPSSIVVDGEGKYLYVADSEGSAIRKLPADEEGRVSTVVGTHDLPNGRALFEFGDVDDIGAVARLQHPLAVAIDGATLFVADTYNHKIKKVDLETNVATTWLGDGTRGDAVEPPRFSEPAGLAIAGGKLFVADTNNHRICAADLKTGQVSVLEIDGLTPPESTRPRPTDDAAEVDIVDVKLQKVASGTSLDFHVGFKLPEGYKLNKEAPLTYTLTAVESQELIAADKLNSRTRAESDGTTATARIPLAKKSGKATLELAVRFGYCRDGVGGLCKLKTARWRVPVEVSAEATQKGISLEAVAED